MLRPQCYLCKVFGLASHSHVADRHNKRVTTDYGYLNCMFTVIWLIIYTAALPADIVMGSNSDYVTQTLFIANILLIISSYASSIIAVVWVSTVKRKMVLEIIENI